MLTDALVSARVCAEGSGGTEPLVMVAGGEEGIVVDFERERVGLSAERERKCFRPRLGFSDVCGTGGSGRATIEGRLSVNAGRADEGVVGKWTKTEVYPTDVRSGLKSFAEGVILLAVVGVSNRFKNDVEGTLAELTDGRRPERGEIEGRRALDREGLRRGVSGAGEPG